MQTFNSNVAADPDPAKRMSNRTGADALWAALNVLERFEGRHGPTLRDNPIRPTSLPPQGPMPPDERSDHEMTRQLLKGTFALLSGVGQMLANGKRCSMLAPVCWTCRCDGERVP